MKNKRLSFLQEGTDWSEIDIAIAEKIKQEKLAQEPIVKKATSSIATKPTTVNSKVSSKVQPVYTGPEKRYLESGMIEDKNKNVMYVVQKGKIVKTLPIGTGENRNSNVATATSDELERNPNLRATPTGFYRSVPLKNIYGYPGFAKFPIAAFDEPAPKAYGLAQHVIYGMGPKESDGYDPVEKNRRVNCMKGSGENRNFSYGCTNIYPDDIKYLTNIFPETDTTLTIDTRNPKDNTYLKKIMDLKQKGGLVKAQMGLDGFDSRRPDTYNPGLRYAIDSYPAPKNFLEKGVLKETIDNLYKNALLQKGTAFNIGMDPFFETQQRINRESLIFDNLNSELKPKEKEEFIGLTSRLPYIPVKNNFLFSDKFIKSKEKEFGKFLKQYKQQPPSFEVDEDPLSWYVSDNEEHPSNFLSKNTIIKHALLNAEGKDLDRLLNKLDKDYSPNKTIKNKKEKKEIVLPSKEETNWRSPNFTEGKVFKPWIELKSNDWRGDSERLSTILVPSKNQFSAYGVRSLNSIIPEKEDLSWIENEANSEDPYYKPATIYPQTVLPEITVTPYIDEGKYRGGAEQIIQTGTTQKPAVKKRLGGYLPKAQTGYPANFNKPFSGNLFQMSGYKNRPQVNLEAGVFGNWENLQNNTLANSSLKPYNAKPEDDGFVGPTVPEYVSDFGKKPGFFDNISGQDILAGAGFANQLLTKKPNYEQFYNNKQPAAQTMSRGDWTTNQGFLQPNKMGYLDKFSTGVGRMQEGGEVEMSDDEVYEFLACGGQLEFLD